MIDEKLLFSPLPGPQEMAVWDQVAINEYKIPGVVLMENAARAAFQVLQAKFELKPGLRVQVLAGSGNNGGDGLALARILYNHGCMVKVICTQPLNKYQGFAAEHAEMARLSGVKIYSPDLSNTAQNLVPAPTQAKSSAPETSVENSPTDIFWDEPELIIDSLLGAGFRAPLKEPYIQLVNWINSCQNCFIFALDLPSGLNAETGEPEPDAVRATATVTFGAAKPGLCLPWAVEFTGRLLVRDIGLPTELAYRHPPACRLIYPQQNVLPAIPVDAHKGTKGRVLIIGGSPGLTGAPHLTALGALRGGAGLVSIAAPGGICNEIKGGSPEIMTKPLGKQEAWHLEQLPELLEEIHSLQNNSALVLGPGLGRSHEASEIIKAVLSIQKRPPLVLDADGLYPLRANPEVDDTPKLLSLSLLRPGDVLTPHPGEMTRILEHKQSASSLQYQAARLAALKDACAQTKAVLVLKGAGTLVGEAGQPVSICSIAEPALAVGGSGDLLAGLIAALLARGIKAHAAAALGVYLHAQAGRLCARQFPAGGNLAGDIAFHIPASIAKLQSL